MSIIEEGGFQCIEEMNIIIYIKLEVPALISLPIVHLISNLEELNNET